MDNKGDDQCRVDGNPSLLYKNRRKECLDNRSVNTTGVPAPSPLT